MIYRLESWILLILVGPKYLHCSILLFKCCRSMLKCAVFRIWTEYSSERVNTFDQLCINYTNERLQVLFVELKLVEEKRWYDNQGLDIPFVQFFDNSQIIGMIFLLVLSSTEICFSIHFDYIFHYLQIFFTIIKTGYLPWSTMSVFYRDLQLKTFRIIWKMHGIDI